MNAAQKLLERIGAFKVPQYIRGGTPPRLRKGKDRSLKPVTIPPERKIKYMHAHARRRALNNGDEG